MINSLSSVRTMVKLHVVSSLRQFHLHFSPQGGVVLRPLAGHWHLVLDG